MQHLESILGQEFKVLDKGYVKVVGGMGGDDSIVRAARVSYDQETSSNQRGLINYLVRHQHTSPLESPRIVMHVKVPLFVERQWTRHRASKFSSRNEVSARYVEVKDDYYLPDESRLVRQSDDNKQGSSDQQIECPNFTRDRMAFMSEAAFKAYYDDLEVGLAREIARGQLNLFTYTKFEWNIDLHNLLHFLKLRTDGHAQWEIRQYANAIEEIVSKWVPITYAAWENHVKEAVTFSRAAMVAVRAFAAGDRELAMDCIGSLPPGERREVLAALGVAG